jgi:copper chaperone NosL
MQKGIIPIFIMIMLIACNPERKPIQYGEDKCAFCRMSIVDQRFGGEIVTQKGKVYMFDAVECMVNYKYWYNTFLHY